MLNKIVKIVGIGTIIGLRGLNAFGSDDYEIWDGQGPMPTEDVLIEKNSQEDDSEDDGMDLIYEEGSNRVRLGLRLNLCKQLIEDCEDSYWAIHDEAIIQELNEIVSTEKNFHNWCDQQDDWFNYQDYHMFYSCFLEACKYIYILKKVNEKNYLIPIDFCKRVNIAQKLRLAVHNDHLYNPNIKRFLKSFECRLEVAYNIEFDLINQ